MLTITIPYTELWDESTQEFIYIKEQTIQMEHSLVSISKWESKWCKPFLSKDQKTNEQLYDYYKCMTITQNISNDIFKGLTPSLMTTINDYINAPMTATWFNEEKTQKRNSEVVTSELIYYWMVALQIPFECQKWHLNRLLTLIRVCNAKNKPPKKMSKKDLVGRNKSLNAQRKARLHTKG